MEGAQEERDLLTEILALQADHLARGEYIEIQQYIAMAPANADELEPLLQLAAALAHHFQETRHTPSAEWRQGLYEELRIVVLQRMTIPAPWYYDRRWAAVGVGSAAFVAGLIVYWRRQAPPAA